MGKRCGFWGAGVCNWIRDFTLRSSAELGLCICVIDYKPDFQYCFCDGGLARARFFDLTYPQRLRRRSAETGPRRWNCLLRFGGELSDYWSRRLVGGGGAGTGWGAHRSDVGVRWGEIFLGDPIPGPHRSTDGWRLRVGEHRGFKVLRGVSLGFWKVKDSGGYFKRRWERVE